MEMQLLDASTASPKIIQPKKQVAIAQFLILCLHLTYSARFNMNHSQERIFIFLFISHTTKVSSKYSNEVKESNAR